MIKKNISATLLTLILLIIFAGGCTKTDITFDATNDETDPGIIYLDNYPADISTFKVDSFVTSGKSTIAAGCYRDPVFGKITAGSYAEFSIPATNTVFGKNVTFDSVSLVLSPSGNYYGDTTIPVCISTSVLNENIKNEDETNTNFYNTRVFRKSSALLGSANVLPRPQKGTTINIRLNDNLGSDLLSKLKANAEEIKSQSNFIKYFKGLHIGTDSVTTNSLLYFNTSDSNTAIRIYYKLNGVQFESKTIDFKVNSTNQFNHISNNNTGTLLSVFTPFKTQIKTSGQTGNRAYIHSNLATRIKISFPTLENLKEYGDYVKIIKAELVVTPSAGTVKYPDQLPGTLNIYVADENNSLVSVLSDSEGNTVNGNLQIDYLYGEKTQYSFDITSLVEELIDAGKFSKYSLMLTNSSLFSSAVTERLVINDQTISNGIQLKLHILGL